MEEKVIGFDAREMWETFDADHFTRPQWEFLLKKDIIKNLSVDCSIWHSVFSFNEDYRTLKIPPGVGFKTSEELWQNLADFEAYLRQQTDNLPGEIWIIAITQYLDQPTIEQFAIDYFPIEPKTIDTRWKFLGYDVAESSLLSGLMNMGYATVHYDLDEMDEYSYARQTFSTHLNAYHLFSDREIALKFAAWCDGRDPGHGPFFVHGVYLVERIPKGSLTGNKEADG